MSQQISQQTSQATDRQQLLAAYRTTRDLSLELCAPLEAADYRIQSMPDVSPPWWNLGHTSWFFAKNILEPRGAGDPEDLRLEWSLNSYYETHGERLPRAQRGLVTRPTTDEILAYRRSVDRRMEQLIESAPEEDLEAIAFLTTTGVHHEQQHQELLVTEVKHILGTNHPALRRPYLEGPPLAAVQGGAGEGQVGGAFVEIEGGVHRIGNLEGGWCWDNEMPVHSVYLESFALYDRLVTHREVAEFIADGGYDDALLWLSNGWARRQEEGWVAPLYWRGTDADATLWTLAGDRPVDPDEPACHLSFYEADAFARWKSHQGDEWAGARLPTEAEWEHGARTAGFDPASGNHLDDRLFHPATAPPPAEGRLRQTSGDLWEWTSSHYEPYPRYKAFDGALMEYNGKFMDNQRVLRGGSCATPRSHIRVSYRNFWPAGTRFQLSGLRLAKSLEV